MTKFGINWNHLERLFRVVAWLLTLAIVMLSLGPPSTRPVTGAGHNFEHLLIFVATGAAFGLGYPRRFLLLPVALLAFTGAIEVAQMMVPGRHARLSDFLTDAAASCVGIGLSFVLVKLMAAWAKS
jgi:VanZ family protein